MLDSDQALNLLHHWSWQVLGKGDEQTWPTDWKLWCGIVGYSAVWYRWLRYGYDRDFRLKAIHVLSLDLIILHLVQYNDRAGMGLSLLLILVQNLGSAKIFYSDKDLLKTGKLHVDTTYNKISDSRLQAGFVFLGQLMFLVFYVHAVAKGLKAPEDVERYEYLHWVAGYVAVQMSLYFNRGHDSQLGQVMDVGSAVYIWKNIDQLQFSYVMFGGDMSAPFTLSRANWAARCTMNFIVNMTFRDIIAFTVPILLMGFHDPLNCVVYSVGVNFIATMDDCEDSIYFLSRRPDSEDLESSESCESS
eukprot:TRINITY_DN100194_c0_g1_i1.p1 TRINITY_DN100194_c0_g1~~TRINITY_DN100194_c0_g1_i1.p1  ORF type:complete len:303 (-),score=34.89 TRINITY_DN100194_c0_g1_i1:8-916(-)